MTKVRSFAELAEALRQRKSPPQYEARDCFATTAAEVNEDLRRRVAHYDAHGTLPCDTEPAE